MLKALSHIARGWYNFSKATPYIRELMSQRLEICDSCSYKQQLNAAGKKIVRMINEDGSLYKCGKCNCPLSAKTADPSSSCPIGKWDIAGT